MRRNISVKEILDRRKQESLSKNKSYVNLRDRSANLIDRKYDETANDRMKRLEHQKEWKKKNYFGGFDSSEDENASLSYKSDESQDLSEYME